VWGRGLTDGLDASGCRTAAPGEAKTEDQLRYESWAKFRDQQCGVVPAGKEDHLKRGFWVKLMDREYVYWAKFRDRQCGDRQARKEAHLKRGLRTELTDRERGEAKTEDHLKYEYWAKFGGRQCGEVQARKEVHLERGFRAKFTARERGVEKTEGQLKYEYWAKFKDRQCGDDQELDGDQTTMKVILLIGDASAASAAMGVDLEMWPRRRYHGACGGCGRPDPPVLMARPLRPLLGRGTRPPRDRATAACEEVSEPSRGAAASGAGAGQCGEEELDLGASVVPVPSSDEDEPRQAA
jgi:hypothetical protein